VEYIQDSSKSWDKRIGHQLSPEEGNPEKKTAVSNAGSLPVARLREDLEASEGPGMGATRVEERVNSAFGLSAVTPIHFESAQSIPYGGVLFLLPFLVESGLMSYRNHYQPRSGYYDFDALLLTLSFLYLLRIKTVEQSKLYNPGKLGKLIGYDRIPEVKKLRGMIKELASQGQCQSWGESLSRQWIEEQDSELYYVDGHVQVYHGYLAGLGKNTSAANACAYRE
jgi:hypothetical protein